MDAPALRTHSYKYGRGAVLEWRHNENSRWMDHSYHESYSKALKAYRTLPSWKDRDPSHWRITCHEECLDVAVAS